MDSSLGTLPTTNGGFMDVFWGIDKFMVINVNGFEITFLKNPKGELRLASMTIEDEALTRIFHAEDLIAIADGVEVQGKLDVDK